MGNFDLGTTTSYFASTVPPGTYYVRVKARNACGVSDASNEVTLTVGAACSGVPGVPGTPAATVSGSSVQLTWGLSSGSVSTYVLEVGSTPGATNLGVHEVGTGSDYRVSGVANGTYYVRLRARNPCGLSLASDTVTLTVDATPAGPPRLEIINSYTYTIETGPNAGHLMVTGEVINRGGAASAVWLSTEVFAKDGSRLRGITSSILGRSRRNTNTGQIESWGLGPGETGCFGRDLGEASEIGRYEVQMAVEADPTTALAGQLQAELTSWYVRHIMGYPELVVFPKATNVGSIPTAWNSVAFMGRDTAGRVVACGQWRVYGPTNAELPGYGFTNVLRPGESAYPLNGQPWVNSSYPAAAVASLTAWPLWKE